MDMMKRVLALLLVCAMLMPNLTTIAAAVDVGEEPAAVSTEPVVIAEEPVETEATEAATEAPTEPATVATEPSVEEPEPSVEEPEPSVEEAEPSAEQPETPTEQTEPLAEETEESVVQENTTVQQTVTAPVAKEEARVAVAAEPITVENNAAPESDYSNDDMLAMYLRRVMYPNKPSVLGTGGYDNLDSAAMKALYIDLKEKLKVVADRGGNTVFTFSTADLAGLGFMSSITAETMGITGRTDVEGEELQQLVDRYLAMDLSALVDALLADCPYELYWYDKVTGSAMTYEYTTWVYSNGEIEHVEVDDLEISLTVADNYIGEGDTDVTPEVAAAAANTVTCAESVVEANASKTDLEKLHAYKQWIMDTVSYDHYEADYGDFSTNDNAWQIIHVFDGNSETNVVCEGYSKAFQYLCDLSTFTDKTLESYLISGYAGGPHMWNIVSIDGRNYLVDVTNTDPDDEGAFGEDGSLFLTGADGSIEDGYTFVNSRGGSLHYTYYYDVKNKNGVMENIHPAVDVYGKAEDSILNLSDISYAEYLEQQEQEQPAEKVEQESYISLRFLENHGNGWFEDYGSGLSREIHTVPDQNFYLIAYLNHWNYENQNWEVEPIHATKLVVDENLVLEPFATITDGDNHAQDGENFDCFFRLRAADGANNGETSIFYSNTEIQAKVTLGRTPGGFYSADPTQQADYDALWLNEFYVGEDNTFWFYYDASRDYETGWSVNSVTATADREIGGDVLVEQAGTNLYTITISDAVAAKIYELRDFWLNLDFTLVKGEDSRTEHVNVNVRATDFGDGNATFAINGKRYHASGNYDGLFTYEGEEGQQYPVPASVPGVSYDVESNTLTLNNAHLDTLRINHHWRDDRTGEEGYDLPDARFNIELVGSNSISATNEHALVIDNEVYLTIQGDGSLAISTTGDENNTCSSAFLANNSDVTIAGNANVTVSISGSVFHEENGEMRRVNMNPIWCNGADRWLRLRDNATLTTHIPDGVCTNGYFAEDGTFVEEGGYNGIQFFYIEVNDNATLNTQTIGVWDEGHGNAYGAYYQNGGTVNITGIPHYNKDHVSEDTGVVGHYHFSGLEADYGKIEINGGSLNIDITATEAQMTKSTYYHGLQSRGRHIALNGGEINFTANIPGTGVKVGEDDWNGGTNAWADLNGATLNMIGTNIYRKIVDVAPNGSMNFNGGVINAKPADIEIRGEATWNGTQANLEGCGIHIQGNAQLNDGFISVKDGFFQVHQGGRVKLSGDTNLKIKGIGEVDGIVNDGTFTQNGGSLVVDVDETADTAAMCGSGQTRFMSGYALLEGKNGLVQFNRDDFSELYVSGNVALNVIGQDAGIVTYAPATFEGGSVNAHAVGQVHTVTEQGTEKTVYPTAVIVENNDGGTNASLTIRGGDHYFGTLKEEGQTYPACVRGMSVINAPVTFEDGSVTIDAETSVYHVTEETAPTVNVPVIVSLETGEVLQLQRETSGAYTVAGKVNFLASQNCGENVTWSLEDGVLTISGTGDMEDYHMPARDPDSWRTAPWYTMRDLITKVVVEEGVEHVGDWAFGRLPEVTEIVYSSTVNRIDMTSNYACPMLEKFTVAEGNEVYSVSDEGKVLIENGSLVRAAVMGITSYKAGDDIRTIGVGAFDSSALAELDLNQVTTIQTYAFADCYDLKTVVIPEGVATIELTAFQNSGIESITIPTSVTMIRNYAFDGCSALADVIYQGTESQWNEIVIGTGNNALTSLPITFLGSAEEVEGEPYLTYRMLRFGDQGYYEVMDEALTELTVPVGFYTSMVVYSHVWNAETRKWEHNAVDPAQLYGEDLDIGLFRDYQGIGIADGEPNADNFFEMAATTGWGETKYLCYRISDQQEIKLPISLTRSNVGFYSEDPTNMTAEERNAAWLNYYPINPNVSGHSVYFALLEYDGDFAAVPQVRSNRLTAEDLAKVQVTEINQSVYKITLPDEVAAKVYDYRGIPLQVTYQIGEEMETVEFVFGSVSFEGECYSFVINGIWYEYYPGLEGYFSWDAENQKRLAHKELPGKITYDYDSDTLTMNNSIIESLQVYWNWHDENTGNSGFATKDDDLTLKLVGENKIINPGSNSALAVGDGLTLTITGDASSSLLISATNENATANSYSQNAVNIYNGADLIIAGDTSVVTEIDHGGKKLNNAWLMNIWAGGNNSITVKDNASLSTTIPEGARDNGDAYAKGYEGIGWFGQLRVEDNAILNTSTLGLREYYDENNIFRGKGSFVQTGGTTTIVAYGFANDEGRYGYQGFVINGGTEAKISGGKLNIWANSSHVYEDKIADTYDWFTGIQAHGSLEISGEDTLVEIQIPHEGTAIDVAHTEISIRDDATVKVVGNGQNNYALQINENGNVQLNGGNVDVTDAKVSLQASQNGRGRMEIHDGTLSIQADKHPEVTYLKLHSHNENASEFILHNGTVIVNNGMTAGTPHAVSVEGRMELNGGTMTVSGTNAIGVHNNAELNQNGTVLKVKGFVQVMTVGNEGVINLNGGITESVLGDKSTGNDGGDIDISGWSLRSVSANIINTWSSAVNVYDGGRLEVNDGHHTFRVDGTPGTDSEGNAIWLGALDVNGEVNFNGGIVQLDAGTGGQAIFNRSTAEGTTVSFNHDMGAVSTENGISLAMNAYGNNGDEYYYALCSAENAAVSSAKITRTSAGSQSSWRIEKDGTKTTLIISGSENMYNYYMPQGEQEADWEKTPWYDYTDQITHVVVEDGINHIGDWVFARMTKLVNVKLPGSVNHISTSAFYGCTALENFTMQGNDNYHLDENIRGEADEDGYYTGNVIIEGGWKVLLAAPSVTSYEVPHFISEIGNGAFQNCSGLTALSFADNNGQRNLWNIGNNAFENTGLTELELPQGISAIGRNAFADCGDLKTIHLPDTVGTIRPYAFSGCGNVTTVTYAGSQEDWSAVSIGTGNAVLDQVTFLRDTEGGADYLSYHWLNMDENGWQENEHSATTEVHTPAGVYIYGVFYHNHWDNAAGKWVATPVIPAGDASLTIEKIDDAMMEVFGWKIAEGETNADFFVRVAVAEGAWDTDAKNNGIVTYNGLTLDIQIHRDECGFYSGTTASDATWLNEYALNPLKPYNNEFYFIFENSASRTMDDSSFRIWNHNNIPDSYFRTYDVGNGIFKIVLDPVFLQDAWEYGAGFRLYAGFNVNVAGQNDPEYKESDIQIIPMDLGNPDAVLEINDMSYLYFKEDNGWMTYGDPANDYRPGVVQLPAGVSYNYSNDTLTLTKAKLNNLSLGHKVYDDEGNPTGEILLPRDQLTLNLVGSNVIETGHRSALNIHGNLNVTVTGSGSLRLHSHNDPENRNEQGQRYAFDTVVVENGATLNIASGNVTAEISGEGYWNEGNPAMPAALRGRSGSSLVVSGGSLTTVVPENARDNGPGEVDFEDYYSTHAIGEFESIAVTGGTLNTTSLYVNSGESYEQSGGTVNITALGHISRQQDDRGNQFQNYHYNGIQIHQDASADISGGKLNLTVTPEGWEHGSSSYYSGLSIAGGTVTISDQAQISVTGAFEGNAISVGYDYDENGQPNGNGTLTMTGGTLTLANEAHDSWMYGVDVNKGCSANITGGTLNLTPDKSFAGISNWGTMTIGGSAVVNLNREVVSGGELTIDGAAIHVTHAEGTDLYAWDIIPGSSFDFKSGTINAKNAAFHIGGEMTIGEDAKLILEDSDFHADGEITLDGGSLTMKQADLVDNLYMGEASDEWGNTWDAYKFQSRLYVSGVLNLNIGDLNLTNVLINLEDRGVLNQNGATVSITNAAVSADIRRTTGNENNDWIASVNVNEDAVLNVGGGSFVMNHTDMDGGLNIRGSMNMRDGTLNAAVPGGIGIAARGQVHVSGGSLTLSGNIGYEQAYENGFDHGKLTVTGGHMDIDAVSGGIDAYNNMVVTGGQIDVTVTGRVDDYATQDAVAVHGLYGTGIVAYNEERSVSVAYNEERSVSVSINGGIVNIELPVDVQGYEEVQLFALAGFDNGTIRINGGDVHTKGRVALYAESRTEGKHLVINNRLHVLSMETGNTLNLTSGVVTHIVDGNTYTWYVDTCEEDEEFTTPKDNRMQVGYANDLRIVSKTAGTNSFWDMEDGVLTISAGSDKIGNMVKNADWNLVADKVTDLVLDQNVEQPADLTQDLFPNLQSVKTPCHMAAAKFTGVTVELIHDLVDGKCQKCEYSEAPADDIHIKINTDNMTLGNSLAINFWVYKSQLRDGVEYTAKLIRTRESGVTETSLIPMSEWDEYGTYYQVVYDQFAAKEMTDTVSIEILMPNGGSASNVFTDSIQEYAMFMLGYSKDTELLTALVDMLNYGTEAQKAFGYQVNDLANARLTAAQQAIATTGFETDDHWGKTGTGYASNLELKDRITLHLWFTGVTSDMYAIVTFTGHNGRNVETRVEFDEFYKQSGGAYSVPINDLVVADGFQPVTCTLYNANGEVVGTCTDSVQSYISYMTQYVASDKYNELYNATMKFVTSAYNIFH